MKKTGVVVFKIEHFKDSFYTKTLHLQFSWKSYIKIKVPNLKINGVVRYYILRSCVVYTIINSKEKISSFQTHTM